MAALIVVALELSPRGEDGAVAVVFPPWLAAGEALAAAVAPGARIIGTGRFGFIVIVSPDMPDYASRVRARGAWFSIDAAAFVGCLAKSPVAA
jgi:selenocysteine lyase/cysteine desulfurase